MAEHFHFKTLHRHLPSNMILKAQLVPNLDACFRSCAFPFSLSQLQVLESVQPERIHTNFGVQQVPVPGTFLFNAVTRIDRMTNCGDNFKVLYSIDSGDSDGRCCYDCSFKARLVPPSANMHNSQFHTSSIPAPYWPGLPDQRRSVARVASARPCGARAQATLSETLFNPLVCADWPTRSA
ncbi:unnamed protein product [Protopolystoma xenopodis]|uniref:Uncharacterized protein n=1 Tax=Protopolystoma xenopodis TaxID=117903 RepID=A0A3S5BAG3_9PLAT|nr:unnamed protein product [Protopolystoma xenopodis]